MMGYIANLGKQECSPKAFGRLPVLKGPYAPGWGDGK